MHGLPAMAAAEQRSALWPLAATIAGVTLAVSAGQWQLGRATEKRELRERAEAQAALPPLPITPVEMSASDVALRRIVATGMFDARYAVYLDNRTHKGVVGYHLIMPLRIGDSDRYVLVNRGWLQGNPDRRTRPQVPAPPGVVTVSGVAVIPSDRIFELSDRVIEGSVWQNLTIARYRDAMPIAVQPFILRQDSPLDDGLVREWPAPDFGIDKHYGYAFQWFALAATLIVFYAVTQLRRRRNAQP
jgi:surfeit locus 1 family protein